MNEAGLTVWLDVPDDCLVRRLTLWPGDRPLIAGRSGDELRRVVERLGEERRPYYSRAAARFDASALESEADLAESVRRFAEEFL